MPAYSWYVLGVLFLVYLLNFVDRQILTILANDIKATSGSTTRSSAFSTERRSRSSTRCSASRSAGSPTAGTGIRLLALGLACGR